MPVLTRSGHVPPYLRCLTCRCKATCRLAKPSHACDSLSLLATSRHFKPRSALPAFPCHSLPRRARSDLALLRLACDALPIPAIPRLSLPSQRYQASPLLTWSCQTVPCLRCRVIDRLNDPRPACRAFTVQAPMSPAVPRLATPRLQFRAAPIPDPPNLSLPCLQFHAVPDGGISQLVAMRH